MVQLPPCRGFQWRCQGLGPLAAGWPYDGLPHYEVASWMCVGAFAAGGQRHRSRATS